MPTTHIPASGYKLKEKRKQENRTTWEYTSEEPSGTILIPIAPYEKIEKNNFQVYYFAEDETGARQIATSVEKVIDLFTKWMGSLKEKHNFSLAEIPNDYGSQALMPTIIQTAKAFKDQQAMGELYHEISHFWNVRDKEIQSPRWNEGQAMYLQYLAYEELNEEGTLLPSLEKRLLRVKEYFESHPEKVAMSEYGKQEVTSTLSYSVGPLFYYLLDRVMGREKLLEALGEFYRKQWESGTTSIEFEEFMVKQDKRTKPIFRDWFTGAEYIELVLHKSLAEIVKKYQ